MGSLGLGAAGAISAGIGAASTIASAIGLGGGAEPLVKLIVWVQAQDSEQNSNQWERVDAMFNPTALSTEYVVHWDHARTGQDKVQTTQFNGVDLCTLNITLFFDTTEEWNDSGKPVDVRTYTSKILRLVDILPSTHAAPFCRFEWGTGYPTGQPLLLGVAKTIRQELSYFDKSGTALRATLTCQFEQFKEWSPSPAKGATTPAADQIKSNDLRKAYVVKRGDTLASIASDQMHDVSFWRNIASANGITDPLSLQPGQLLKIPTSEGR